MEKKIHYIWLGKGSKPNIMDICINSWREKLPNYEIIEWNEENLDFYNEIKKNRFLEECYKRKLWAFLSDYFRVKVLYENGGIYLDSDMQILKSLDRFLDDKLFLGMEDENQPSAGIIGAKKG
ncbi:MAG: glycosyltransferase family 32 protein, partial [Cetobacterium sp.]